MKKIVILLVVIAALTTSLISCGNKMVFDTTYSFEEVIAELPNGEILEGKLEGWTDYEDGDQIQIKVDGKVYLVHSTNCALISK